MSILRSLFGPSREEIWRQFSDRIGGRYIEPSFFRGPRVEASHAEWLITLDTYAVHTGKVTVVYTRMRAPYVNPDGYRFTVYRRRLFSGLATSLGMQDVEVGFEPFDRDFVIKGTDEARLRQLFSNARIRERLSLQPDVHFSVKDDEGWFGTTFPSGVDELYFQVSGVIKDVDRLKLLYDLFAETLDELCRMGSAYEAAPDVTLG